MDLMPSSCQICLCVPILTVPGLFLQTHIQNFQSRLCVGVHLRLSGPHVNLHLLGLRPLLPDLESGNVLAVCKARTALGV